MKKTNNFHVSDFYRFKIMKGLVTPGKDKIIVDLGGGLYPVSRGILSKKTFIVDGDKKFNPDIVADLNNTLPFKSGSVDTVIAGEIIEHLINPFRFLLEIKRILKKNGELILSTPNEVDIKSRFRVLFGKLPTNGHRPFATTEDQIFAHKANYNFSILNEMLTESKFEIEEKTSNGIFLGSNLVIPSFICPLRLGEKFIVRAIKK